MCSNDLAIVKTGLHQASSPDTLGTHLGIVIVEYGCTTSYGGVSSGGEAMEDDALKTLIQQNRITSKQEPEDSTLHDLPDSAVEETDHTLARDYSAQPTFGYSEANQQTQGGGYAPDLGAGYVQPEQTAMPQTRHSDRHEVGEQLGSGGMGSVFRVRDPDLRRWMAMKVIHSNLLSQDEIYARFIEEAQITSQLEHPSIVPVHTMGWLEDGRVYFTMKQIRGQDLKDVLSDLHAARTWGKWETTESGWTFRRMIDAFRRVCEALAYAHDRNVIHRDIKPANIMVGDYGEVLVVDWGLAKVVGRSDSVNAATDPSHSTVESVEASEWREAGNQTMVGTIAGTPTYMAPEQVTGDIDKMGPPTDVYALGSMLYHIIQGHPPFHSMPTSSILYSVVTDEVPPFDEDAIDNSPEALRQLAMSCLAKKMEDRPQDAGAVAKELEAWLDGSKRREQALLQVKQADSHQPDIQRLRGEIQQLRNDARTLLAIIRQSAPSDEKEAAWKLETQADERALELARLQIVYVQELQGALSLDPSLSEAHRRLAGHYVECHRMAEANREASRVAEYAALIERHDLRQRYAGYLDGEGSVSLSTDPEGAMVSVLQFKQRSRRLIPMETSQQTVTPIKRLSLGQGSYLLKIQAPGRAVIHYPIKLERQEELRIKRPGEKGTYAIRLPWLQSVEQDEAFVAPGYFSCGGDEQAASSLPKKQVWVSAFVMKKHPVSNAQYLKFLNDLVKAGRFEEAVRRCPRRAGATLGDQAQLLYSVIPQRGFMLDRAPDKRLARPAAPVCAISWEDAMAYASWHAGQVGKSWRLPGELEWEKAARGADARAYPWGNFADPSWACCYQSHEGESQPALSNQFSTDLSPYGISGLGGNMATWCLDRFHADGPPLDAGCYQLPGMAKGPGQRIGSGPQSKAGEERVIRGGAWAEGINRMRSATRHSSVPQAVSDQVGIRLVASIPI